MGIHTALDTNGYLGERLSDAELDNIDLVLLDIKAWTPQHHRQLTGMDVGAVLAFARRLDARKKPVWLRYVLAPGCSDDPGEIEQIARFAAGLGVVERVDVLPFHQMGRFKWEELGIEYKLRNTEPPSREAVERAIAQFRAAGLEAY
jgi:pyruvate formate lyase activating enzyme